VLGQHIALGFNRGNTFEGVFQCYTRFPTVAYLCHHGVISVAAGNFFRLTV